MATMTLVTPSPFVIGPQEKCMARASKPLPQYLIDDARDCNKVKFNSEKHVNFAPPERIYTMEEIGLKGQGISTTAISDPFPLWTPEAVTQIRAEVFSPEVLAEHHITSSFASDQIRGYCPDKAPFIYNAWNDPRVLQAVSSIAGVDLVPMYPLEIGHTNVSIPEQGKTAAESENTSAFAWHYDSYPFVCVTILSDCSDMVGGETEILMGNGETRKVRGPTAGSAVVMQGGYIKHQALKARVEENESHTLLRSDPDHLF